MKNDKELGNRLARVVDRISRGEFILLALEVELEEPGIVAVSMRLRRLIDDKPTPRKSKISTPPSIIRDLIFDD